MKTLLIDPPFYRLISFYNRYFPIGLTTVGTFLKKTGWDVVIYDADCNHDPQHMDYTALARHYRVYLDSFKDRSHPVWKEVEDTIAGVNPDIAGISIWTTYAASAFHVAMLCKKVNPDCVVVMGGPHATVKADEILAISPHVDYVIKGEGEITLAELVKHRAYGRNWPLSIPGLSFRHKSAIIHNPAQQPTKDLDRFPFPDRSLLMNKDKYTSEDMGLIMTSRGCPYACSYCATHTKAVRYRSIDSVINEIKLVKKEYKTTQFSFKDDSFTVNRNRVERFCDRLIAERLNINWECNTRVDLVTESLLAKMKKAGCNSIKVGVESGSERVLQSMNKGITHQQVKRAASLFNKLGIHWTGYFMMGVPGEKVTDVYKTLDLMYLLKPHFASVSVYEPFPGTPMFVEGLKRGLVKPEMTIDDFYTTLPNHYYKRNPERQVDTIELEQFPMLEQEIKDKFHNYNKNFKRLLSRAKSRTNLYIKHPDILFTDFKKYLSWR